MKRLALWPTTSLASTIPSMALAQQPQGPYYGHHMWDGGWFIGPLMMLVFAAIIVAAILIMVRWFGRQGRDDPYHKPSSKAPLDILKERFALGEIDKEEFEARRKVLSE